MLQLMFRAIFLTSFVLLSACGGGSDSANDPSDTQAPTVVSGGADKTVGSSTEVAVVFSESINTSSLDLTGSTVISGGVPTAVWSTTTVSNDTLTLSGSWNSGLVSVDVTDAAGNSLSSPLQFNLTLDDTAPTGSSAPLTNAALSVTGSIVLSYDEAILDTSIVLSGAMQSDAGVPVLTGGTSLSISPATSWTSGDNQTLSVTVTDVIGNSVTDNLTFHVLDGAVYVDTTNGSDVNPGSATLPKSTIQAAITVAQNTFTTADVRVATGTYTEVVTMADGISLLGGYSVGFGTRDATTNVTTIDSTASLTTVTAASIITDGTLLDGFTINGSAGASITRAITVSGSSTDNAGLTVSNNIINGGSGTAQSYGVYITGNVIVDNNDINGGTAPYTEAVHAVGGEFAKIAPVISNNTIDAGGVNTAGSYSYGVWMLHSSSNILNNTISAGNALTNTGLKYNNGGGDIYNNHIEGGSGSASIGLDIGRFNTTIYNNTIYGGSASFVIAIKMTSESISINSVKLYNNTIDAGAGTTNYAIAFLGATSNNDITNNNIIGRNGPATTCLRDQTTSSDAINLLRNNNLYQCDTLYVNTGGAYIYTNTATLHTATAFTASGNESLNPNVVSATDYHLTATTPNAVATGGVNLSSAFTTDKDGVARVFGMGAYVYVP